MYGGLHRKRRLLLLLLGIMMLAVSLFSSGILRLWSAPRKASHTPLTSSSGDVSLHPWLHKDASRIFVTIDNLVAPPQDQGLDSETSRKDKKSGLPPTRPAKADPDPAQKHPLVRTGNTTVSRPVVLGNSRVVGGFLDNPSVATSAADIFSYHNVSGESKELLEDLYRRVVGVRQACASPKAVRGKLTGIFTDDASRVAYCFLPKVGCTFWIRVFSFLHNFTREAVSSPWDISRLKVHNTPHSHGVFWTYSLQQKVQHYLRFIFVRHPFSRLWSAYVDKLFLPDFWKLIGVPAVIKLRGENASREAVHCGHDLTFPEFVQYSLKKHEPHWDPIYLRCDPCQFQPSVVGSMASFAQDSLFLLRRMGLEWVLRDVDRQQQVENELSTLVRYNFEYVFSKKASIFKQCVNASGLVQRLWRTFQINGYILDSQPLPSPPSRNVTEGWFLERVLDAFRAAVPKKMELKEQKRRHLVQALASLSPELMSKVRAKYQQDMFLFGFDDYNY